MVLETIMYLVGYNSKFVELIKKGWGCGYLLIPLGHPFLEEQSLDVDYPYFQVKDFSEEITLTQKKTVNDIDYILIGFDTAHSWNTPEKHNFDWCLAKTLEMKMLVDKYK